MDICIGSYGSQALQFGNPESIAECSSTVREIELSKWLDETKVEIEMAEKYIYEIEMQIKQGEEHDAEEAEAERLADNEQEHAQEMRAQYEEELRSEGTDN